ncbi:hypothetical protein N7532_011913 [Penicillium argentinense]|uniref:Uncharacterized protein n=1 Tax=Penicillium argentinense TaxID=1131581 RepID=A0A9W9EJG8_9EURO|nr:uncharacterized protein N7532_011913 [Penicillium argentinense]KAJ5082870.1 hypothetical protein N7532_011913 [Penicillium argentinense]
MQLSNLMLALVAIGASLGLAAPSPEKYSAASAQGCPKGWEFCGINRNAMAPLARSPDSTILVKWAA